MAPAAGPAGDLAAPISAEERARERALLARLAAIGGSDGTVRFDRFIEEALYGPAPGRYEAPESPIGRSGEFYTAPSVSPLFARALGRWILSERDRIGRPKHFAIVELGPGDGTLAEGLLTTVCDAIGRPASIAYRLIDRSERLRMRAFERVRALAETSGVELSAAPTIAELGPFAGVVVANEVLDALPFRRFVRRVDGWHELLLRVGATGLAESESSTVGPGPDGASEGARIERSPAAEALLREVADHLTAGGAIFLDYGSEEPRLLAEHPEGTLAAYRRHRRMPDPLAHPGLFDLSAFVNFSRIRDAAAHAGLTERSYRSQAEALVAWGLESDTRAAVASARTPEDGVRVQLAVKNLLFGFAAFQALELEAKGGAPG